MNRTNRQISIAFCLSLACLVCLFCPTACDNRTAEQKCQDAMAKQGGVVVSLAVSAPEFTDSVAALLNARLTAYGTRNAYVSTGRSGLVKAQVPGIKQGIFDGFADGMTDSDYEGEEAAVLRMLLLSPGELEIWETYNLAELLPALTALDATAPVFTLLHPYIYDDGTPARGPMVGHAAVADKGAVTAVLTSPAAQAMLPADLRWGWAPSVADNSNAELIALKARDGKAAFTGECLTDIRQMPAKECAYPNISMEMADADAWEKFTGANTDRSIAFVIDHVVYAYPTVMTAIPGGKSQISGNLTRRQAAALAAIVQHGPLPCRLSVAKENIAHPK